MNELAKQETRPALTLAQRIRQAEQDGETRYAISKYNGVPATDKEIVAILTELATVYPVINSKIAVLVKLLTIENFTAKRLNDACTHVLATCKYKEPTIADIVSFDRCVKLYTYSECLQMINRGVAAFDNAGGDLKVYNRNKQNGLPLLWYRVSDAVKCGLLNSE